MPDTAAIIAAATTPAQVFDALRGGGYDVRCHLSDGTRVFIPEAEIIDDAPPPALIQTIDIYPADRGRWPIGQYARIGGSTSYEVTL